MLVKLCWESGRTGPLIEVLGRRGRNLGVTNPYLEVPLKTRTLLAGALAVALAATIAPAALSPRQAPTAVAADPDTARASGGTAVAHRAGGRKVSAGNRPEAVTNWITSTSGEPTLGLTKDGDIFFSAITTNTRVDVMHSENKGETWDIRSPQIGGRNVHLLTMDPYVYVDPRTDRLFTIDLTVACSYLSFSDDKGESWTTNPVACGRPVNDHQTLFAGPPVQSPTVGYDNIVYYCWNDVASSACSKSLDGGLSFTPTGSPAFAGYDQEAEDGIGTPGLCGGLHGHGVVDDKGTIYLPREYCGRPYLAMSKDEGLTWERVQVSSLGVHGFGAGADNPDVAVDAKGNIYYTWIARDRLPYLSVSSNGGKDWSKPVMFGVPGLQEADLATVDVGDTGKIAIAYMGSTNSKFQRCKPECETKHYKDTTWNGYVTMTTDAFSSDPLFYTASVNRPNDPLKRNNCGPGRCGTVIYDFLDVVIGPDGIPYTAFVDACNGPCVKDTPSDSGNEGLMTRLVGGPKLR